MVTELQSPADTAEWTVADLLERFGPISLRRIRFDPFPGTATERDVLDIHDREDRLYELVDGVLVEKAVGTRESYLAALLIQILNSFVRSEDLGFVLGADGMARLNPGLVRIPDLSFVSWDRVPGRKVPATPMLQLAPDLAVEVLSPGNTAKEMQRKLQDYFGAGVRLVWYVDPRKRRVQIYTAPDRGGELDETQTLTGDPVLPGFSMAVKELFARLD